MFVLSLRFGLLACRVRRLLVDDGYTGVAWALGFLPRLPPWRSAARFDSSAEIDHELYLQSVRPLRRRRLRATVGDGRCGGVMLGAVCRPYMKVATYTLTRATRCTHRRFVASGASLVPDDVGAVAVAIGLAGLTVEVVDLALRRA